MNISPTTPVSGMNAANFRMDTAANNVANVNTQDFQARGPDQADAAARATETAAARPTRQAADTYEPGTGAGAGAEVAARAERTDLSREMTDMAASRNAYTANAEVVRAQDEVANMAIDLVG
jgi:flagellar hook protein FlgE